jgi:hypothetical protein
MRLAVAALGLCTILIVGLSFSALTTTTEARDKVAGEKVAGEKTYLIPASDGYGVAECLTTGAECGKIVAKAWCESKGHKLLVAFGQADRADFTGSVPSKSGKVEELPLTITCN